MFVLPDLAASQPGYVNDVLAVATSGTPVGDVGRFQTLSNVGITYIVGGVIFGIALFRADVLARWAAVLMSVGAVATVATFQLPELTQRLFAIPAGVALIGLGYSLWRDQRTTKTRCPARSAPSSTRPAPNDHPLCTHRDASRLEPIERLGAVRADRPRRHPRPRSAPCDSSGWPAARS